MRSRWTLAFVAALLSSLSAVAAAHDFILWPRPARLDAPGVVEFGLWVGDHLAFDEQRGYRPERALRFELLSAAGSRDLRAGRARTEPPFARIRLERPGGHLVVLDRPPIEIALPPDRFTHYLEHEGLGRILAERRRRGESQRPGRERYTRHLKAFVQVGPAPDGVGCRVAGQELEIVPGLDPASLRAGDRLPITLRLRGRPLARHRVEAMIQEGGRVRHQHRTTGPDGRATVRLDREGTWLLRTVAMSRCEGCSDIEWRSRWTAFTFTVGAARASGGRARPCPTGS